MASIREGDRKGCVRRMVYFKTFIVVYFLSSGDDMRLPGFRRFPPNHGLFIDSVAQISALCSCLLPSLISV